jgi:hypothetical protein
MPRAIAPLALLIVLLAAAPARAGDAIMPLSEVRRGMQCTGLSVVQGTEISSFGVEILDVVVGGSGTAGPMILVRVSGPAVDSTGIASGFSGSPIYCADGQGVVRNAGAIALGLGEYGNKTVLATPIEAILGESPDPPSGARAAPVLRRAARPLAAPLTVSGAAPPLARALAVAGRKVGRVVLSAPAAPASSFPVQTLRPGASVAVALSSGNLNLSAVGTVAYTDGDRVWAFGHPLDNAGRRSLLLQDAYVYTVVGNPLDTGGGGGYKLASPGHDLGTLTNDAPSAIVGRVGALPPRVPLRIVLRDGDTGRVEETTASLVDESAVNEPTGTSSLAAGGAIGVINSMITLLRGTPARLTGSMCFRIKFRERRRPAGFCNRYVGGSLIDLGDGEALPAVTASIIRDIGLAAGSVDAYEVGPLHVQDVRAELTLRRGARAATIVSAGAPRVVRAGSRVPVRLRVARRNGTRRTIRLRVPVPRATRGLRSLLIEGTPLDGSDDELLEALGAALSITIGGEDAPPPPRSVAELARDIADIHVYDGVRARFADPDREEDPLDVPVGRPVFRDRAERITGNAELLLRVLPPRRR